MLVRDFGMAPIRGGRAGGSPAPAPKISVQMSVPETSAPAAGRPPPIRLVPTLAASVGASRPNVSVASQSPTATGVDRLVVEAAAQAQRNARRTAASSPEEIDYTDGGNNTGKPPAIVSADSVPTAPSGSGLGLLAIGAAALWFLLRRRPS